MVIRCFFYLALLCIGYSGSALALTQLTASIDKNPITEGESVVLNVTADDNLDESRLDISALKKDFIVAGSNVSHSTVNINSDIREKTQWQIFLFPKSKGTFTLPVLSIDGINSVPFDLVVNEIGEKNGLPREIYLETQLSTHKAYIGQLVTYQVKLYLALQLQRGLLTSPEIQGAQLKQLGEDNSSSEIINGRQYRVIERNYSIFPDKTGTLTIKGAQFDGDVVATAPRRGMFSFNQTKPVHAQSESKTIKVVALPATVNEDTLVADLVILQEDWPEQDKDGFTAGTPITRTISLLASNAEQGRLADIHQSLPASLKLYPENAKRNTYLREGKLIARWQQTSAIVPSQAGTYTLPEIQVPWWNPRLHRQEIARLPAKTIVVKASATTPLPALTSPQPQDMASQGSDGNNLWFRLTLLLGTLWLITVFLWWRSRRQPATSSAIVPKPSDDYRDLKGACERGKANEIIQSLQLTMSQKYQKNMTLEAISALSPLLSEAISELQNSAYGKSHQAIDGQKIIRAVAALPSNNKANEQPSLMKLNP